MSEPAASRPHQPAPRLVVLTCMDARLDLFTCLGLQVGEAHFIRNAGGRVTSDVILSLALSTNLLGAREIGVIHHADCGLQGRTNDDLVAATGLDTDFLPFDDLDASIRSDVEMIRAFPWLRDDIRVWGSALTIGDRCLRLVAQPAGRLPRR